MAYSSIYRGFGTSASPFAMSKANRNYTTRYAEFTHSSGDIRMYYDKVTFTGVGGGEVYRAVASAGAAGTAYGGTINAAHFTGQVASGKTVAGSLNAIRATLEVAGTTPTPGGKLAALRVDSNISTGWTGGSGANQSAFISVGNNGAGLIGNLFCIDDAIGTKSDTALVTTRHADATAGYAVKFVAEGTTLWLLATSDTPAD